MEYFSVQFETYKTEEEKKYLGSECNKIIIIMTDGGIEKPEKVIYEKDPDRKIRIFTYAMGLAPTPLDAVRWLACTGGGMLPHH